MLRTKMVNSSISSLVWNLFQSYGTNYEHLSLGLALQCSADQT